MKSREIVLIIVAIIVASLIVSASIIFTQFIKQSSIEKQKQMEIIAEEQVRLKTEKQMNKEYIVKRNQDCYELENSEREKYNNVISGRYNEEDDRCYIKYRSSGKFWDEVNCADIESLRLRTLCEDGEYEKIF